MEPLEEFAHLQSIGGDAFEGIYQSVEDVVATAERIGPFDGEHVTGLFDDTENGPVASRITTQRTDAVVL
jgi:hypothetical protein